MSKKRAVEPEENSVTRRKLDRFAEANKSVTKEKSSERKKCDRIQKAIKR